MVAGPADSLFPDVAGAQLLVRAIKLLFYLREREQPVTASELAEALGIPSSNVYRLVHTLELSGLVERSGRGRITLGLGFLDLGRALEQRLQSEIAPAALPVMRALTAAIDETTLMTMPTGLRAICVLVVDSSRPIRLSFATGRVLPLQTGASGKVLLPWLPARLLEQVLHEKQDWPTLAGAPLTRETLQRQIEEIREQGYAITCGEVDPDAVAVAAPVFGAGDRLVGALTAAGPTRRFQDDRLPELVEQVRAASGEIGERLKQAEPPR